MTALAEADPVEPWANPEVVEEFWERVSKDGPIPVNRPDLGPCWPWTGKRFTSGYGRLNIMRFSLPAHRLSWEIANGQTFPAGLVPDHLCMNKPCVRPGHLDPCTQQENIRRWAEQAVTACPQGHVYTAENTLFDGKWRRCKKCRADYELKRTRRAATSTPRLYPGRMPNQSSKLGWLVAKSGFALYEVGAASGVSYTHMSEYVNLRNPIRPHHLLGLCDFFDLEPEDIVGLSGLAKNGAALTSEPSDNP